MSLSYTTPSSEYHHGDTSPAISLTGRSILLLSTRGASSRGGRRGAGHEAGAAERHLSAVNTHLSTVNPAAAEAQDMKLERLSDT